MPFYYSLPWGEDQLTNPLSLLLLHFGTLLILGLNVTFAALVKPLSNFYSRLILVTTVVICFLVAVTNIQIILLLT